MENFYSYEDLLEEFNKVSPDKVTYMFESMFDRKNSLETFLAKHANVDSYIRAQQIIEKLPDVFKPTQPILLAALVIFGAFLANKSYAQSPYIKLAKDMLASVSTVDPTRMTPHEEKAVADSLTILKDGIREDSKYMPGQTIEIPLTELGKPTFEYSGNETIKEVKLLEGVAAHDGNDADYLSTVTVVIHFVESVSSFNSTTAYTEGLGGGQGNVVTIYCIPVPNSESLAEIIGHELKHSLPYLVANIMHLGETAVTDAMIAKYVATLDDEEHIDKSGPTWKIAGIANPLELMLKSGFDWAAKLTRK